MPKEYGIDSIESLNFKEDVHTYWHGLGSPKNVSAKLEDGTWLLPYECENCKQSVIAAGPQVKDKYTISISNYHYCPYCGQPIEYIKKS